MMILADIGNRHVHLWQDGEIRHLSLETAIAQHGSDALCYINVSSAQAEKLATLVKWRDIAEYISIAGEYEGMGIDRKALCLSHKEGIFVDAGSAVTVDKVTGGMYRGGYILPGIHAYTKAFGEISPVLDVVIDQSVSLDILPKSTRGCVSYGIIAPLIASIEKIAQGLPIYCTGGDGLWLSRYFKEAVFSEALLFRGMIKMIEKAKIC